MDDSLRKHTHTRKYSLNVVLGNIFAQRLLLSLRTVEDPGTRAVISSLVFNDAPNDNQRSGDSNSPEGRSGSRESSDSAEILGCEEVEVGRRCTYNSEA